MDATLTCAVPQVELTAEGLSLLKQTCKSLEEETTYSDAQTTSARNQKIVKNWVNMTTPKETNEVPISDLKEMEIYKLSDKAFRIILLKKFSELQEHTAS